MERNPGLSRYLFTIVFLLLSVTIEAQSLPSGTAGIVYSYDAAGNRTKVEYVLNNTQAEALIQNDSTTAVKQAEYKIIKVNALYPNPTTGRITVRLVKPLLNAHVRIMDISGHVIIDGNADGSILNYDLTSFPTGVYLLFITQGNDRISLKILKR